MNSDKENASRRCSIFLSPAREERPCLEALMGELCVKLDLPTFEPHVTLFAGLFPDPDLVGKTLAGIAAGMPPITLKVKGIRCTAEYFKSVFIEFAEHPLLDDIHGRVRDACGSPSGYELAPHLSLLYADLPLAAKEILARGISLDRGEFRFDEVKLVTPLNLAEWWRDTGKWQTLCRFRLAGKEGGPPLRAVLFDFGGVLATEGFREGLMAIARRQGLDPAKVHQLAMDAIYESGYITGRGSEADFWAIMRDRTGIDGTDAELCGEILGRFAIRPKMIETARRLKRRGFITAILSDQTDWLERLDARDGFSGGFDRVFNSFHLGKGKRDPSIFTDVAAALGISPHEALFVDDMPGNVERAISMGMRGIVFRDEESFLAELEHLLME
ncbi:MAG TPA: HAD-IA family hydrolase [Geobacteraceae bacterium]|nr:HAD-IA family hydrolase [Geobacteraceae bacterium]